ncbi:tyrosine phosphatase family-domain-containing protein [Lipomyces tetrasporus]|uniref:Tyrosine phosphatase family-domain-containing protein n=1 Tax=Lipomyces tetrasporus TaxID=54092 RepID=A0AAD7QP05_9ASCO|nr:tyrosine phosphatase family-domain-containing protein [Lipomyces tetrasporus]KAJ8098643.1 tyrosine phosphatase family-domain-containing protein [Lipomyces tetrasporus]
MVIESRDASFSEERLEVPFSLPSTSTSGAIVGILTSPTSPSYPPSVIVIMHGFGGHKNYCYQKMLARKLSESPLGLYSFRFDFRGCGESAEIESPDGRTLDEDLHDIMDVLHYVREIKKLYLLGLAGHSRGALAGLCYAVRFDHSIPNIINCSGRFRAEQIRDRVGRQSPTWEQDKGHWADVPRYMQMRRIFVPANETYSLAKPNMNEIVHLPSSTSFLTIYGLKDTHISVNDSEMYANLLGNRHTLKFIPEGDHNFYAHNSETGERVNYNPQVAQFIADWISPESRRKRFLDRNDHVSAIRRWKVIDGVLNFRELGGWKTRDGRYIRTGYIFRSAQINTVTEIGMAALKELNICKSFDLRSSQECQKNGAYEIPGLDRQHVPLGVDEDMSPEEIAKKLNRLALGADGFLIVYREFLEEGIKAYRTILEHIRDQSDKPLIIHCTAGKDRTGIICALILLLADVDADTVARY